MFILNVLKAMSVMGTIVLGILGARYDYKKDGQVTKHGRVAIVGILLFGSFAVVAQFVQYGMDKTAADNALVESEKARERLQKENDRQSEILVNTRTANDQTADNLTKQQEISRNLTKFSEKLLADASRQYELSQDLKISQLEAKRLTEENFRRVIKLTDENFARIDRLTNENFAQMKARVEDFDNRVTRNVNRLSSPLRQVFVSYQIEYDRADERFPAYYNRMKQVLGNPQNRFQVGRDQMVIFDDSAFPGRDDGQRAQDLSYDRHEIKFMSTAANFSP